MKPILVIERDGPLQKSLKRLFSSAEEYEVDVVADGKKLARFLIRGS